MITVSFLPLTFTIDMQNRNIIKGQGAQRNVINRFERHIYEPEEEDLETVKTAFTEVFPKTIVNQVKSDDLPMEYSMNPYQGCEHGCSYCFARPTHDTGVIVQALTLSVRSW